MSLRIYQVDAFTDTVFAGNPAAVMPLDTWLPDNTLQDLAAENNLSETAFFVPEGQEGYRLRWFTPAVEVDLCGHATLASAYVIMAILRPGTERVEFATQTAGPLAVTRRDDVYTLDFPSRPAEPLAEGNDVLAASLAEALGGPPPVDILAGARDYMVVYDDVAAVATLKPDMVALAALDRSVLVTAPGVDVDFVSRFFAPGHGIPEDPVTGSTHCALTPYWAARLDKTQLSARQLSARGGQLWCELRGDRVMISGKAMLYMEGTVYL
ncbi:isomerase [Skermanella stibiiresistens SB22]|uniref:Isomerase n=1 Tax=Skermanella stibiiresistens SB22 TaxID=1385369 RepID=W9GYC7_9PROT|nr:PhzF family phenazine biosynthesis protein [Skermanella stibiiresistens]EWY38935.1 isomerase [Skermanella stibiiresistens SB22]